MLRCYIGLGSNLNEPLQQVEAAVQALAQLPESRVAAVSPWYRSAAVGPGVQPDYVNGVLALDTQLQPQILLNALQQIETARGRVRDERWGARTLDLDILLFGDLAIATESLTIPHPGLCERQFVLLPLLALAPELRLPDGRGLAGISAALGDQDVTLLEPHRAQVRVADMAADAVNATKQTTGDSL